MSLELTVLLKLLLIGNMFGENVVQTAGSLSESCKEDEKVFFRSDMILKDMGGNLTND